jgi:excinuclease ABC subunit B
MHYNEEHGITPTQIVKGTKHSNLTATDGNDEGPTAQQIYMGPQEGAFAADPIIERMTRPQLEKSIANTTKLMKEAAKNLDFLQAAQYRDEIIRLQKELELKN